MGIYEEEEDSVAVYEELEKRHINYISFSLFQGRQATLAHCNHKEWLEYYNLEYREKKTLPPVVDYFLNADSGIIIWDQIVLDQATANYLKTRNNCVGCKTNITILTRNPIKQSLSVLTLGTWKNTKYLLGVIKNDSILLEYLQNAMWLGHACI